ncbi:hypothetical protein V6N11_015079 [Hibiscus sabdariffa]|uniref:Uncharacterized protein n=1 Tax=Hibiscus sabdariffa TaxID=183260 RepID=A0ABR2TRJ2_9ROSI
MYCVAITLSNKNPDLDFANVGFFLCTSDAWKRVRKQLVDEKITCALESNLVKFITDHKFLKVKSSFDTVFRVNNADKYTLILANCLGQVKLSMNVRSAMYNLEGKQNRRDYLSVGETILPVVYFLSSLVSFALAGIWIYVLYKRRLTVSTIHYLMLVLVILQAFNLVFEAENKHYIKRTGRAHDGDTLFYIFSSLKGTMFYTVLIAFIVTGWPHFKPYLQDKEKKVLLTVIPLQVFAHIALASIEEYSTHGPFKSTWIIVTSLLQLICCCTVSLWMFRPIRKWGEAARTDEEAAVKLKKLRDFVLYYATVICYIYLTRVVVYALETIAFYKYAWMGAVVGELIKVVLCVFVGYKSMPEAYNPHSAVDDEEKDVAAEQLLTENEKQNGE